MFNDLKLTYTNGNTIKSVDASCCTEGVPISVKLENTVLGQKYLVHFESIGPGTIIFEKNDIIVYANAEPFLDITNIVSLQSSNIFLIKTSASLLDKTDTVIFTVEDIASIECTTIPPDRPTPTVTPTVTNTPTVTTSVTPSITPTISNNPTNTPTISLTPSITPTISITPTNTYTPSITPTITNSSTVTPTNTPTITLTPSVTATSTSTPTPTPTRGLPIISFEYIQAGDCLTTEQILYVRLSGLWIGAEYSYEIQKSNNFAIVPVKGSFVADKLSDVLKIYISHNDVNQCNISYVTVNVFEEKNLVATKTISLNCDGTVLAPTPTPIPNIDNSNLRSFACGELINSSKLTGYNPLAYKIETGLTGECDITIKYRFFSIPEKLSILTATDTLLYDTGFVGNVEKDADTSDYIYCPGLERISHTNFDNVGPYSVVTVRKPSGATYIKLYSSKGCLSESEWEVSSSCNAVLLPTPNPTKCPDTGGGGNIGQSPTPTQTPTPTPTSICAYSLEGSIDCSNIDTKFANQFISIDKLVSSILLEDKIVVGGSSTCIDSSYDVAYTKVALAKISSTTAEFDSLFGLNGKRTSIIFNDGQILNNKLAKLLVQSLDNKNKKLIAISDNKYGFFITRFNVSGSIDSSFGLSGQRIVSEINNIKLYEARDALITEDRKILILGEGFDLVNQNKVFVVIRLTENGFIDTSFGNSGVFAISTKFGNSSIKAFNIHYDETDDEVYVVSESYSQTTGTNITIIKINQLGLVVGYGENGILYINDPSNKIALLGSSILPDKSLLVTYSYNDTTIRLVRLSKEGTSVSSVDRLVGDINKEKYNFKTCFATNNNETFIALNILETNDSSTVLENGDLLGVRSIAYDKNLVVSRSYGTHIGIGDLRSSNSNINKFINKNKFFVIKYNVDTNAISDISIPLNYFNRLNEHNYISDITATSDTLYLAGYTGSGYDYDFAIIRLIKSVAQENTYFISNIFNNGNTKYVSFADICNVDQYNIPDIPSGGGGECPCLVTTPTPSVANKSLKISEISYRCEGSIPTARIKWDNNGFSGSYILEIIRATDNTQIIATNLDVSTTSGIVDFDLSTIANTDKGKTCQVRIIDTATSNTVVDSKLSVLTVLSC